MAEHWEIMVNVEQQLMRKLLGCSVSGLPERAHKEPYVWCASAWCLVKLCEGCAGAMEDEDADIVVGRRTRRMWCERHASEHQ